MNYKKALENIILRRKEQLAGAAEAYASVIKSDARLYSIELKIRSLNLSEIMGGESKADEINALEKEKNELLASLGITSKLLNPPPLCKKCGDTGLSGGKLCQCVKREAILDDENIGLPLKLFSDSDPGIEKENGLDKLYAHMRAFTKKFPDTNTKNVVLLGSTGTGKTYLASCIAGEIIGRGYSVVYLTAFEIQQRFLAYHTTFDQGKEDSLLPLIDCDLLIIDDLGTESLLKNVTKEYLYIVINERGLKGRHTVITTNLSIDDISARYGEKIVSRLFDKRIVLSRSLEGNDLRKDQLLHETQQKPSK